MKRRKNRATRNAEASYPFPGGNGLRERSDLYPALRCAAFDFQGTKDGPYGPFQGVGISWSRSDRPIVSSMGTVYDEASVPTIEADPDLLAEAMAKKWPLLRTAKGRAKPGVRDKLAAAVIFESSSMDAAEWWANAFLLNADEIVKDPFLSDVYEEQDIRLAISRLSEALVHAGRSRAYFLTKWGLRTLALGVLKDARIDDNVVYVKGDGRKSFWVILQCFVSRFITYCLEYIVKEQEKPASWRQGWFALKAIVVCVAIYLVGGVDDEIDAFVKAQAVDTLRVHRNVRVPAFPESLLRRYFRSGRTEKPL